MPKIYNRCSASEFGFTLIELLIALAISSIFLAGVIQIFSTSSTSYSLQEDMAAMQQNIRVGKMFIERDARMAGCGMNNLSQLGNPIAFTDGGTSGSDTLTITYVDLGSETCALPQLTLKASMPDTSSEADVNEILTVAPYSDWASSSCTSGVFRAIITSSQDPSKSEIIYITNVQPSPSKLQNRPYYGYTKQINTYPAGSTINFFKNTSYTTITYSYQSSDATLRRTFSQGVLSDLSCTGQCPSPTSPTVYGTSQTIAENIEDLQFAFGLDTTGSGSVDTWVNSADLTTAQQPQVRLVRINILGRTAHQHPGQTSTRPAIENHTAATVADHYSRQLLTTTVEVRNMR